MDGYRTPLFRIMPARMAIVDLVQAEIENGPSQPRAFLGSQQGVNSERSIQELRNSLDRYAAVFPLGIKDVLDRPPTVARLGSSLYKSEEARSSCFQSRGLRTVCESLVGMTLGAFTSVDDVRSGGAPTAERNWLHRTI